MTRRMRRETRIGLVTDPRRPAILDRPVIVEFSIAVMPLRPSRPVPEARTTFGDEFTLEVESRRRTRSGGC